MDKVATPHAPTGLWDRLLSAWNSNHVQLRLVLASLFFYMADVITDILLAVQYYNNGDFHWFGWTLGFMMAPPTVMSILLICDIDLLDIELPVSKGEKCLLNFLHLAMPRKYNEIINLLSCGKEIGDSLKLKLSKIHLYETTFESIPQLCLQFYIIISTGEHVSVLKVISMVISLLAAVKAAVTFMYHDSLLFDNRRFSLKLIVSITICKIIEISGRVLEIGLCASVLKQWVMLPIVIQWLILLLAFPAAREIPITDCKDVIECGLHLGIGTLSSTFPLVYFSPTSVWNAHLTYIGNIGMGVSWCVSLGPGAWYKEPLTIGVIPLASLTSSFCLLVLVILVE